MTLDTDREGAGSILELIPYINSQSWVWLNK